MLLLLRRGRKGREHVLGRGVGCHAAKVVPRRTPREVGGLRGRGWPHRIPIPTHIVLTAWLILLLLGLLLLGLGPPRVEEEGGEVGVLWVGGEGLLELLLLRLLLRRGRVGRRQGRRGSMRMMGMMGGVTTTVRSMRMVRVGVVTTMVGGVVARGGCVSSVIGGSALLLLGGQGVGGVGEGVGESRGEGGGGGREVGEATLRVCEESTERGVEGVEGEKGGWFVGGGLTPLHARLC